MGDILRVVLRSLSVLVALLLFSCGDEAAPVPEPTDLAARTAALGAADRHTSPWDGAVRQQAIDEGRAVITRLECNRCHTIDEIPPAARPMHCVSCHQWLHGLSPGDHAYQTLAEHYGEAIVARYQRNIDHYREVPDLTRVARRIRPEWIREFLPAPEDLRPSMDETMVRTRFEDGDVRALVRYFAAVAEVRDPYGETPSAGTTLARPDDARIERGHVLFAQRGCNVCHLVGNVDVGRTPAQIRETGLPARLAPNLRFARERMDADVALQWILDPPSIHPTTSMPDMRLALEDATLIRDFLWFVDPRLEPMPPPIDTLALSALPAVDHPVGWAEVKARVIGRICVHCHMNDEERDGGPGNIGGYGYPVRHLSMRTYEALVAGVVCEEDPNRRCSVLEPELPGHLPPLLEVMLERRDEERRDHVAAGHDHVRPEYAREEPGMPMGLPSIPDDEVALVARWIADGCPGPTEVTGMGGITDGFLVPDGPIDLNQGCQLRAPSAIRPAWATQTPPDWMTPAPPVPLPSSPSPPPSLSPSPP